MLYRAMSLRDHRVGVFHPPHFFRHEGEALRMLENMVNNPESLVYKVPQDFAIYEVGSYDDASGVFEPLKAPRHVAEAAEYANYLKVQPEGKENGKDTEIGDGSRLFQGTAREHQPE